MKHPNPIISYLNVNSIRNKFINFTGMISEYVDVIVIAAGVVPGIFRRGTDYSDEGAKIWFSGYYKCQKSPKKSRFTF